MSEREISTWKIVSILLIFTVSLAPYLVFALTVGLEDLVYFFLIWVIFFVVRPWLAAKYSIILPIVCGIMLAFPASTFLYVGKYRIAFNAANWAYTTKNFEGVATRLIFYIALMLVFHFLLESMRARLP